MPPLHARSWPCPAPPTGTRCTHVRAGLLLLPAVVHRPPAGATQPICDHIANSTDMINFHALLDNQRFVLGPALSIVPVGVSAQEPASVSGPGVWRGASGSMPAPYDGERRVRSEGQKGREAFYVYISSLQYSEGKSAQ